jgi:hypothetical protein
MMIWGLNEKLHPVVQSFKEEKMWKNEIPWYTVVLLFADLILCLENKNSPGKWGSLGLSERTVFCKS